MKYKFVILLMCITCGRLFATSQISLQRSDSLSDFECALYANGNVIEDLTEQVKIKLPEPQYAIANFSGFEKMPDSKVNNINGWLEFYDGEGNYFKKRVIISAQGNSSLIWPKKNISIDICDDEWIGDETPDITFGKWVKQDSFHLKAYYTDYFRGLAVAAYRVYDDIISTHGDMAHPWQRAGVADADEKARCHPDGFPVGVYLNGEFYGVFSWQLKKHRKNMGMTKDCPEHIHLDGKLTNEFFFGNIDWTQFEIRNPKTLYCQDGSKYDGNNPKELIDESSEFFDTANKNHLLSAKVKQHILRLCTYTPMIQKYRDEGRSVQELRDALSQHFDVQGLIDYTIFSSIVNNTDGWEKNWQWITYDGDKWYVEPYDLDVTFGNTYYGYALTEPEYHNAWDKPFKRFIYNTGPFIYIHLYFADDLDRRYADLRIKGIIDAERILEKVRDWHSRVGEDNYTLEYEKWSDSYCVQDMIIDKNWSLVDTYPNYSVAPQWNVDTTYQKGDMCKAFFMVWMANNEVKGIHPCPQPGYRDSLERVEDWIKRRISIEDDLWNFNSSKIEVDTSCDVVGEILAIYNVNGEKIPSMQKGINFIKYSNGKTMKIMVK